MATAMAICGSAARNAGRERAAAAGEEEVERETGTECATCVHGDSYEAAIRAGSKTPQLQQQTRNSFVASEIPVAATAAAAALHLPV